jgi:hypothetical protein
MGMKKIISVRDYIIHCICEFPTLYAAHNFRMSSMKVMDQLLNVNGNGIRDGEELLEHITFTKQHTKAEADKWIREKIYYGYLKVKEHKFSLENGKFRIWKMPEGKPVHVAKCDLKKHPESFINFSQKNPLSILTLIFRKNIPRSGNVRYF